MKYFYSGSTHGFYTDTFHKNRPADCVEISEETHVNLMAAQASGKAIGADADGNPMAVERVADSQQQAQFLILSAKSLLTQSDEICLRFVIAGQSVPQPWLAYRAALRAIARGSGGAIPTTPEKPQDI